MRRTDKRIRTDALRLESRAARVFWVLAALALAPAGHAQWRPWTRLSCESPAFSVEAPSGWRLEPVADKGARLLAPGSELVVEVVAWAALRPPATPEKAARQHDGLLGRAFDYRRGSEQWTMTDEGTQCLVVIGSARAEGLEQTSVFCAYADGDMHYVLGAFCRVDDLHRLRTSLLDKMMASFRPGPAEVGVTPVGPDGEVERPPTDLQIEPRVEPVLPPVEEQEVPWAEHQHELGFSLSLPADWRVSVSEGRILVAADESEPISHGVIIWPVTGREAAEADVASRLLTELPMPGAGLRRLFENRGDDGVAVVGAMAGDEVQLLASYACNDYDGLLVVAVAPVGEFNEEHHRLARIATSFEPAPWEVPVVEAAEEQATGDAGLLRWRIPRGWQSRGGAQVEGKGVAIAIEAMRAGEGHIRVAWHQPLQPGFRTLTALLSSLGWREGEQYGGREPSRGMLVYKRRTPLELLHDYLLPGHPRKLSRAQVVCRGLDAVAASLLPGQDAQGTVALVSGEAAVGPRERLCVVATATAPMPLQNTCWQGAELRAEADEGALSEAVAALALVIRSAEVTERAADEEYAPELSDLLVRAQRSLGAIPTDLLSGCEQHLPANVLDNPTAPSVRSWVLPSAAMDFWRETAAND